MSFMRSASAPPVVAERFPWILSCSSSWDGAQHLSLLGYFDQDTCIGGHAEALLVEALCYKPEGSRFESRMRWFFFNLPNPSNRAMALGSTQPLTERSTRNLPGVQKRPARRADNLDAHLWAEYLKMWEPQPLATLRAPTACTGITLPLPYHLCPKGQCDDWWPSFVLCSLIVGFSWWVEADMVTVHLKPVLNETSGTTMYSAGHSQGIL
jgi:hypothetical protein